MMPWVKLLAQVASAGDREPESHTAKEKVEMDRELPTSVQMQFMRPGQLEAAIRAFPVVYVPFGLIEWHGRHLPLGNDAMKAHAILVKTAQKYGGVVYPPVYYPSAVWNNGPLKESDLEFKVPMVQALFQGLKQTGFRVIIGVSGHNIPEQIRMIDRALEPVIADGTVTGKGFWEVSLSQSPECGTDHAAKWETSNMMYFYPDLVDLSALGDGPLAPDMKAPDGIGGQDPRKYASAAAGARNCELCADALGKKAQEMLASLAPEHRGFSLKAIAPGSWWQI
jgi:creatinine amidohydrolase